MKITKFEQSGFIIEADNGYKLALDIGKYTPIEKLVELKVDAMIVSHIHGDHFHPENIVALQPSTVLMPKRCSILFREMIPMGEDIVSERKTSTFSEQYLSEGGEYGDQTWNIRAFCVDHGPNVSEPIPDNFGFLIEVDGKKIFFCGDMYYPSGISVSDLEVNYLLVPVGGHYTFGPQEALDFAKKFKRIGTIIPIHYEKNNFVDPSRKDEFVEITKEIFNIEVL